MSLNIIVLAKQVPDTRNVGPDAMTPEGTVNRSALPAIFNPEDLNALEQALRLKDANPGSTVTVITMGPPRAAEVIRESLYRGADGGYLLTDRAFAGADTLATSYALAATIQKLGMPDVILGGRQAIDGDTAQVGPEIAEHLDYPQVTYAVEARVEGGEVLVKRETGDGFEVLAASMPCVVTVTKPYFDPRFPTIKSKLAAGRAQIPTLTADDLPVDRESIGLKGSPTKVKKSFTPPQKQGGMKISEDSSEASARKLFAMLSDANIIG